jgi:NAD(P)-dependent dehydrogenase (short-subunit alcohol dehydrogenase family)
MQSVVITGVSSGIGLGAARVLTAAGFRVYGSVRKRADADRLKQDLGERFTPLVFDVTDPKSIAAAADKVRAELAGEPLFGLVNNAGIAVAGPLLELPLDEIRRQLEVNLIGVIGVTQAFAPLLWTSKAPGKAPGRIVNISSVGGKSALPFLAPYNASKFALEGLSESLRREMLLFGVKVVIIAPGMVSTEMAAKGAEIDIAPYKDGPYYPGLQKVLAFFTKPSRALRPEQLGQAILKALTVAKPKVRYTVAPDPMQTFLIENLPKSVSDRMIGGMLGLKPAA